MSQINTKKSSLELLGLILTISVPATLADYQAASGKTDEDIVDELNKFYYYRGPAANWRAKFAEKVEAETGIKRKTKVVGGKEVYDETEKDYIERVVGEDTEYTIEQFKELGASVADEINWCPTPGGGRIAEKWEKAAESLLEKINGDTAQVEKLVGNLAIYNVPLNLQEDGLPTVRDLAGALKLHQQRLEEATKDGLLS